MSKADLFDKRGMTAPIANDTHGIGTVVRVESLTPRVKRVTFTSDAFTDDVARPLIPELGRDCVLYIVFPSADGEADRSGSADSSAPPDPASIITRVLTIRGFRDKPREMDVDFVAHEGWGPCKKWVETVAEGVQFGFLFRPTLHYFQALAGVKSYVLAGDDTAAPSIGAVLEHLPAGTSAQVCYEVVDKADEIHFDTKADLSVTWLHRGSTPAGTSGLLEQALRGLEWPTEDLYCWVAGEAQEIKAIRRYLREERKLTRSNSMAVLYWRRGMSYSEGTKKIFAKLTPEQLQEIEPKLGEMLEEGVYEDAFD